MNDGINPDKFTLHSNTIDQIICMVSQLRRGALKAKFNVEAASHNIAGHPSDRM